MVPRLDGIRRAETLQYLSYHGSALPDRIRADLDRCEALLLQTARPRLVWKLFSLLDDGTLEGTDYRPGGEDIHAFLQDCDSVVLLAATLGAEAESLIRRAAGRDMADAVILDAAGSAAIETVCDNFCDDLAASLAPRFLTDRFSPGYGDMPLSDQHALFRVLDVSRRIGVTLSQSALMIPQKSVTALIGVSDRPQKKRGRSCESCGMFETCPYRKEGKSCGSF
ncbi:MAG: vitamin B12 dependent methionine synthase, activation domain protein [Oscillospiraceae bacterium]|nr:vitamin B12 dependent methionine synthase, activation domain protein [Oscillospiraceae bacterium]